MKKFAENHRIVSVVALCGVILVALGFLYFNKPGESKVLRIPCLFHLITGLYCPGCGLTRMIYSCLHLDFYSAIRSNLLSFFFIPFAIYLFVSWILEFLSYGKIKLPRQTKSNTWIVVIAVVVVLFWVLRNIPIEPFSFLAPIELT